MKQNNKENFRPIGYKISTFSQRQSLSDCGELQFNAFSPWFNRVVLVCDN